MSERSLVRLAQAIWNAGVAAVDSRRLVEQAVQYDERQLVVCGQPLTLWEGSRLVVVGAGKAGAGMAAGVEAALGERGRTRLQLSGWVNVPADCVRQLSAIELHAARPAGRNEPTAEGVRGTREILRRVAALGERDICLCLLSGGGSALLPAPLEGITLADKQQVTRHLSAAGANIGQLNTVRKQLSHVKGGRLADACRAGQMVTLVISDVIGDPLDVIASGPTYPDSSTADQALEILQHFDAAAAGISPAVFAALRRAAAAPQRPSSREVPHFIVGNNQTAVDAAAAEARARGFETTAHAATELEGAAEDVGRQLAQAIPAMAAGGGKRCRVTGGEPIVSLCDAAVRGKGGRNQQLVLAAAQHLRHLLPEAADAANHPFVLLSGGTDGEDGPTDAAGAWCSPEVLRRAEQLQLASADFLRRNDAYHFFQACEALWVTGPTHTNVCDVRVVLTDCSQ